MTAWSTIGLHGLPAVQAAGVAGAPAAGSCSVCPRMVAGPAKDPSLRPGSVAGPLVARVPKTVSSVIGRTGVLAGSVMASGSGSEASHNFQNSAAQIVSPLRMRRSAAARADVVRKAFAPGVTGGTGEVAQLNAGRAAGVAGGILHSSIRPRPHQG